MLTRRIVSVSCSVCIAVLVFSALMPLMHGGARAESYEELYECLIDLKDWEMGDPEGMKLEQPGFKMIHAMREYSRESKEVSAMIMMGTQVASSLPSSEGMMNMETSEGKFEFKEVDSFKVYIVFDKKKNSGVITVLLTPKVTVDAVFSLSYENMTSEEALELSKKFDWKKIRKRVDALR